MKYLKCEVCGNVVKVIKDSGVAPVCCGKPMVECNEDECLPKDKK